MKRLFLVTHKMTGGGCERVIAQLLADFVSAGIDCTLVSECRVKPFYALPEGLKQVFLLDGPDMRASDVLRAYQKLRALVRREKPDVVLAMPEKVNVWTVLFLLGTGVPVVVSERNDPRRHPQSRVKRMLRTLIYPFAAGFIFQTQQAADCFDHSIRARGIVLPNPLDLARLPAPNFGAREKTVVGAGRLSGQKNFPLLIRAFAEFYETHPDWRLVIYGEGEERAHLQALIDSLPIANAASLPGQTETLPSALAKCGLFVLCSSFEGMPNALIEAMATGTACIATDCPSGGCAALVQSGENGLLVPVDDLCALTNALTLLADGPDTAAALGRRAARMREQLDARVICERWRRYLDSVVSK